MSRITIKDESSASEYHHSSSEYDSDDCKNQTRILDKHVKNMIDSNSAAD